MRALVLAVYFLQTADIFTVQSLSIVALPTNLHSLETFEPRLVTVRKVKQQLLCSHHLVICIKPVNVAIISLFGTFP